MASSGFMTAKQGRFNSLRKPRFVLVLSCVMTQLFEDSLPAAAIVNTAPKGSVFVIFVLPHQKSQKSPS